MTPATKVSSCVECKTPIIGARPRCRACRVLHDSEQWSTTQTVVAWLGAVLIVAVSVVLFVVIIGSC